MWRSEHGTFLNFGVMVLMGSTCMFGARAA